MKPRPDIRRAPGALHASRLTLLAVLTVSGSAVRAGAQTDGTAGGAQTLSGKFTVPQSLGTLSGANLFHSFQSFGINPGESATFTTTTPLQNVVARVTGGVPSTLNGPLKLDAAGGGRPSLFLINPSGITSGAGSSVEVPGAFHLSTANYLKFADGSVYQTDLAKGSSFSVAAPSAFGFVSSKPGAIVLQDADLTFKGGQTVTVTAGDITINNITVLTIGGSVRIAAVGQAATEVALTGPLPAVSGKLVINGGAQVSSVSVSPAETGELLVSAGEIVIGSPTGSLDAGIVSAATGAGIGGAIQINAANAMTLQNGGKIVSFVDAAGQGGNVEVDVGGKLLIGRNGGIAAVTTASGNAGSVKVVALGAILLDGGGSTDGASIGSETSASGRSGTVLVSAAAGLALVNGGKISSQTFGAGQAGLVKVEATSITLDNRGAPGGTGITSSSNGTGNAGTVDVKATGALTLVNGSSIQSSTFGTGQAGTVTVNAGSILLDGSGGGTGTGIASESGAAGNAGNVHVAADADITISNSARISSSTFKSGNAGSVKVSAASLSITDAKPGGDSSGILSVANQTGNAGNVDVAVIGLLSIADGIISTSTFSSGRGGAVTVKAGSIAISNTGANSAAGITSNAAGTGDAGSISVTAAQTLSIVNAGTINSSTLPDSRGAGGAVSVTAGSLQMDGRGSAYDTSIASETYGSGNGGTVLVAVRDHLSIVDQAGISSSAYSSGNGGLVRVQAGSITLDKLGGTRRTGIGSVAFSGSGDAGSVDVSVTGALALMNGSEISANTSTAGAAGSVRVNADTISVASGASINSGATQASSGRTGDVSISAGHAVTLTDSRFSIENNATVALPGAVPASALSVTAPRISLVNSEISASASGNIAAGHIVIEDSVLLCARDRSGINTSAVKGQGGSVVLRGGGALLLDHSRLTTSVTGTSNGDGGPISIDSPVIVLNSGFVQANTAVAGARGGDVSINVAAPGMLIASRQQLISGGQPVRYSAASDGPNVIQAARPDGVNGDLRIASPQIDLSASLATLPTPRLDFNALGTDVCRVGDGSSLTPVGRGGLRPSDSERVRPTR